MRSSMVISWLKASKWRLTWVRLLMLELSWCLVDDRNINMICQGTKHPNCPPEKNGLFRPVNYHFKSRLSSLHLQLWNALMIPNVVAWARHENTLMNQPALASQWLRLRTHHCWRWLCHPQGSWSQISICRCSGPTSTNSNIFVMACACGVSNATMMGEGFTFNTAQQNTSSKTSSQVETPWWKQNKIII